MRPWRPFVHALALVASTAAGAAEAPPVVASIKPVHSLVAAVMAGVGEPHLLVRGGASPHDFALKPSDARALAGAGLVFWIGRDLETALERPLRSLASKARIVALSRLDGLVRHPLRTGATWQRHEPSADHGDDSAPRFDMHLWLDPANAAVMVDAMARHLAAADASRAAAYRANAATLKGRLGDLDGALRRLLARVAGRPYVVYHDAYRYLEERYGLTPIGAVAAGAHRPPGAARLGRIRDAIRRTQAACVFAEPQFAGRRLRAVADGGGARIAVLDPLGAAIAEGPHLYAALMRGIASALRDCLAAAD